jgi:hypothetical protein
MKPHDTVLIWTGERCAWWRPQGVGYTDDRDEAGRWFFDDALATVRHCGPEKRISFEKARVDTMIPIRIPLKKVLSDMEEGAE